jgi:predicted negative regulator of RcsB-dependent stress response
MATHRPADVLVANTYSKAVLRTAAETVITTMPFVHYYPSFEGVNLSDRKIAWLDDMTHVSDAIVQVQVARMVEAFVGSTAADDAKAIAAGGETMAIERARNARSTGGKAADEFFVEHVDWSSRSTIFALEHARHLLNRRLPEEALKILDPHAASEDVAIAAARCEALLAAGQADAALAVLDVVDGKRIKSNTLWDALLKAALGAGDRDAITSVLNRLMKYTPARSAASLMHVARHFRDQGDIDSAIRYYQNSVDRDRRNVTLIELADVLVTARRADEARDLLTGLRAENSGEAKRLQRLTDLLGLRQLA